MILPNLTEPLLIESAVWHEIGCYGARILKLVQPPLREEYPD
ncbi:hypothetical protein [Anthocerotibacter panamensis]|nr:hypothetical protein [Anthocerotibacter panamensis]